MRFLLLPLPSASSNPNWLEAVSQCPSSVHELLASFLRKHHSQLQWDMRFLLYSRRVHHQQLSCLLLQPLQEAVLSGNNIGLTAGARIRGTQRAKTLQTQRQSPRASVPYKKRAPSAIHIGKKRQGNKQVYFLSLFWLFISSNKSSASSMRNATTPTSTQTHSPTAGATRACSIRLPAL